LEHIEIIDTALPSLLHERWFSFTPTLHYQLKKTFDESRIARWPRRTCESWLPPMTKGVPCESFPISNTDNLIELQKFAASIARYEVSSCSAK